MDIGDFRDFLEAPVVPLQGAFDTIPVAQFQLSYDSLHSRENIEAAQFPVRDRIRVFELSSIPASELKIDPATPSAFFRLNVL